MDCDERELLLAGWGIWARDDPPPGWSPRVGSAEGAYLSPGEGEPRPIEIPEPVTEMVDAAVARVRLDAQDVLLAHYVKGFSAPALGGQLVVDAAVRAVADRLGRWPDLRWRGERLAGVAMAASG